ncbi:Panacea domain-containing protein [Candidatus Palauibacter sp.]|uniref:Panacea domain-containing protein n=1 Tax=Candidatus Palauibacter sp. TaxID=3101350 RepID=UPI003D0B5CD3
MLGLHDEALVHDSIRAWEYGPVILDVYHRYKQHGRRPIPSPEHDSADFLTGTQQTVIQDVVEEYDLPFEDLFRITHHEDSPWTRTWTTKGRSSIIPNHLIREHYLGVIERARTCPEEENSPDP